MNVVRQINERHTQIFNNREYQIVEKLQEMQRCMKELAETLGSKGTSACGEVKRGSKKDDYQMRTAYRVKQETDRQSGRATETELYDIDYGRRLPCHVGRGGCVVVENGEWK